MKIGNIFKIILLLPYIATSVICINSATFKGETSKNFCPVPPGYFGIYLVDGRKSFKGNTQSFTYISPKTIDKITAEGSATLSSYTIDGENITCNISDIKNLDNIIISFYRNNKIVDREALYFAKSDSGFFCSSGVAIDEAKLDAGQKLNYSSGREKKFKFPEINIGASGSVCGILNYKNKEGKIISLRNTKVKVKIRGSLWEEETTTNDDGFYRIRYHNIWYIGSGIPEVAVVINNENRIEPIDTTYGTYHKFNKSSGDQIFSYTYKTK